MIFTRFLYGQAVLRQKAEDVAKRLILKFKKLSTPICMTPCIMQMELDWLLLR